MKNCRHFEVLLDEYFGFWLAEHPVAAAVAGIRSAEGKLGGADARSILRRQRVTIKALERLDEINPRELTPEQHLDRLAFRSFLLRDVEDFARGVHRLNPDAVDTVLNVVLHELQRGEDEPKRAARNIESILLQVPRYLRDAATVVEMPETVWLRVMNETVGGAASLFDAVEQFFTQCETSPKATRLLAAARVAVGSYGETIKAKPLAVAGSYAIGAETLQRRVRDELGLDYTLGEIESLAKSEIERIGGLLAKACRRFGTGNSPDEIVREARAAWNPGENLVGHYRDVTMNVTARFKAAKAVTFPKGDELQIRLVPEFMQHLFPTAAYSSPGAFERRQRGVFWVNDLSTTRSTEKGKLAERQQHFGISLTAAHEAYPGHHLQFVTANRHPRKWRRLFAHAVFYEGWTLWCEQMMVDLKIDSSPLLKVQQLHDALWRVHRILVDLRLQTGRYSYVQAAKHLQKHLGFTKARSEAEINWYSMSPGVPMSYWLGRLENERLFQRLVKGRGWSLQQFNDWLLSFGTIPQSWIEKYGLE